jgi:hypothetical protein
VTKPACLGVWISQSSLSFKLGEFECQWSLNAALSQIVNEAGGGDRAIFLAASPAAARTGPGGLALSIAGVTRIPRKRERERERRRGRGRRVSYRRTGPNRIVPARPTAAASRGSCPPCAKPPPAAALAVPNHGAIAEQKRLDNFESLQTFLRSGKAKTRKESVTDCA